MKILYQVPHLNTIYAGRTIYMGYKHAFEDLGHQFKFLTVEDNQEQVYKEFKPNILITSLNPYFLKYLNTKVVSKLKKQSGMKVFVNTPFWKSPFSKLRVNEAASLSQNPEYINLIKSGNYGDVFYNATESGDERMDGFEKATGYKHITIPLAADKLLQYPDFDPQFASDIAFVGTALPGKIDFFKKYVFPLRKKYKVKIYGQDWTLWDKSLGIVQKVGHYYNFPILNNIQKPKLNLDDERRIYTSAKISINIHEGYQLKFGGDCNERTFKIPLCEGFEIVDCVSCIKKYFDEGKELIIAQDAKDWLEKVIYFLKYPHKRDKIIKAGRVRVLNNHTYHNRVEQILNIYKTL